MATNYALPRKPYPDPNDPNTQPLNTSANIYDLQRRGPVTQGQQIAEQQNTQGLQTGQFADVQSAQNATSRTNALRTANALQDTRGTFARSGADFSPEAASRAQDQAFSAAEAQNLNGTNATNQLQRQYRTDAIANAGTFEKGYTDRQTADTNTIGTLGNLDLGNRNAATAEAAQGTNQQNANTNQFNADTQRTGTVGNLEIGNRNAAVNEAAQGTNQQNADTTRTVGLGTLAIGNRNADISQQNANTNATDTSNRYDLGKGELAVSNRNADTNLMNANTTATDVSNRAAEAAQRLGYDYASLSQADKQYFLSLAEKTSEFGVTSGQTQEQINNQKSQYDLTRGDQKSQFATTSGQTQQEIDARNSQTTHQNTQDQINAIQDPKAKAAAQAAFARGGDVSQFIASEYNPDGSLNPTYASANPGKQAYQAKIDELKSYYPDKTDAEIQQMAQTQQQQDYALSRQPATTATTQNQVADASKRLAAGGQSPDDLAKLPAVNPQSIPNGDQVKSWLAKNDTGGWTNIGGTPYKVTGGGSDFYGAYTVVQDQKGVTHYMDTQGRMHDALPPKSNSITGVLKGWQ